MFSPCTMSISHLWSGLASMVIFAWSEIIGFPVLVQSNTSWKLSLAGTSSGSVTHTGTILIPPGPKVRSGLLISKETLGTSDKFPAVANPLSVNESSPFPGFCNRRISLVLSLTLNTAPSLGVTTSASAL